MSDSLLAPPPPVAKAGHRPARLERQAAAAVVSHPDASEAPTQLAEPGSERRWGQLQRLRRGSMPLEPWVSALASGQTAPEVDLLAALWARLDRAAVARLLDSPVADDPGPWLRAGQLELPPLATQPEARAAWLEPLLQRQAQAEPAQALAWLQLLGQLRDPRVAERLRVAIAGLPAAGALPLLPLLGLQRDPHDLPLLLERALQPGPLSLRRAALEGLAVGLSSWPVEPLARGLEPLASDLDPDLAGAAVDLLARLPQGRRPLRRLLGRALDPAVRARLRRRLPPTPLVLLVHGRQGGVIPAELQTLAAALAQRRGAPVLLQGLTAEAPEGDAGFWAAARRAEGLSLVPLLLLPGGHVRGDLPAIAAAWQARAAAQVEHANGPIALRRLPFLGAWPAWQRALAEALARAASQHGAAPLWLHHPLQGALPQRFLGHLAAVLRAEGLPAPYTAAVQELGLETRGRLLLQPLTLAANRLSESLSMGVSSSSHVLPPLLENPALRQLLIAALEDLP
ncbi:MAG: CbiX/SirB N-terminal domain-containing protein [Vulcanococcus sp.]